MAGLRTIGLLGGTFDPIHHGHLAIASEVLHALELDQVLFVPAGRPPHKPDQIISSDAERLRMLELAIAGRSGFGISMLDLERNGPSYSVDLLRAFRAANPAVEPVFILGADSLVDLPNWRDPDEIARLARIAVAGRPGVTVDMATLEMEIPALRGRVTFVDVPLLDISSRDLRQRVRDEQPIWYLLPRPVEEYIEKQGLYR